MLLERPPCPPSTITYSSPDFATWKVFNLPTHRPKNAVLTAEQKARSLRPPPAQTISLQPAAFPDSQSRQREYGGPTQLEDLPVEVQQNILDMLIGNLSSTSPSSTNGSQGMRNWSNVMRHPRRKQLSDLALVSGAWRRMVQERLYRHIKIKGTKAGLEECADWFLTYTHLQPYVRHIEVWIPVWERRPGGNVRSGLSGTMTFEQHTRPRAVVTVVNPTVRQEQDNINLVYQLARQNAALDEIFGCVGVLFPSACILTIEGGHCKKPPMIQHFRETDDGPAMSRSMFEMPRLPKLPNIRTLVLKGAWNIIRERKHFEFLSMALPNLREWHCTFAKPKTKAYQTISTVLRYFPSNLTRLNICLEGFYSKDTPSTIKVRLLQLTHHLCEDLGRILPQLEALTLTGRVCNSLFRNAIGASESRKSRLKSVDLVVKNCCREFDASNDGTGIHNWDFIRAFGELVTSAVGSLGVFPDLSFLRIRFLDLDSPCPFLNPYFQLQDGICTGIWTEEILGALGQVRPAAVFPRRSEDSDFGGVKEFMKLDMAWPRQKPKSIMLASYAALAQNA